MRTLAIATVLPFLFCATLAEIQDGPDPIKPPKYTVVVESHGDPGITLAPAGEPTYDMHAYCGPTGCVCDSDDKASCLAGCRRRAATAASQGGRYLVDVECSWSCTLAGAPPIFVCQKQCRCLWMGTEALLNYQ